MQSALRPYATAGVALVGASVIAVSPVTVTPTAVQEVRDSAVHLSALVNPIEEFGPIFQQALANVQTLGQQIAADPAQILEQLIRNQATNIANLPAGLQAQIRATTQLPELLGQALNREVGSIQAAGTAGQALLQNFIGLFTNGVLQQQLGDTLQDVKNGDFATAFNNVAVLIPLLLVAGDGLENLGLLPPIIQALQQPLADAASLFPIAAGPLNNAAALIGQIPNIAPVLVIGALSPVSSIATAAGNTLSGLIEAAQNGDPAGAVDTIITQAANATGGILTDALAPGFGIVPTLVALRQAIAAAITTPATTTQVAELPAAAAHTFTVTAPLEKAPEPKALTTSGIDKTGSAAGDTNASAKESTGTPTSTDTKDSTKDSAKGGNLFTSGNTATKGGRHRADTGNFAQGLRDTIKGLTGLGRDKPSEGSSTISKSGESASSSSGSGSASAGGGSEK